jgi:hypothetical protein
MKEIDIDSSILIYGLELVDGPFPLSLAAITSPALRPLADD